jgi:hypothetical protein
MNIFGIVVDPMVVAAILSLAGGGVVSVITQLLKNLLKLEGVAAVILTGAIGVACVAAYFLIIAPPFVFLNFAIYAVVVFGEATGWYHFLGPSE